ncbi:MAG: sigma-E factor negative regulatory protein [Proteobacteria bacterium]|nr:sigma-E factor negative regulatory protein [Pseudomonadota bacterium]
MNDGIKMQISAFVDGELPENEAELLLRRLSQDLDLRQQAAEYLAMGHALRGHRSVQGADTLRERIAAAIGDHSLDEDFDAIEPPPKPYLRSLAGFAIAASVALAAILGLQQFAVVPDLNSLVATETIADSVIEEAYTVPGQPDGQILDYFSRHSATISGSGANNINARLATFRSRDVEIVELVEPEEAEDAADTDVDSSATPERQSP